MNRQGRAALLSTTNFAMRQICHHQIRRTILEMPIQSNQQNIFEVIVVAYFTCVNFDLKPTSYFSAKSLTLKIPFPFLIFTP
jgi:hypothetical protein